MFLFLLSRHAPSHLGRVVAILPHPSHHGLHHARHQMGNSLGIDVGFGFVGSGCSTNDPFVDFLGVSLDMYVEGDGCEFTGNWPWIERSTPYTAELTIHSGEAVLSAEGVGRASGTVNYEGPYTTLWVGNTGRGDWPECWGTIDSLSIEALD